MLEQILDQSPDVFFWQDTQGIIRGCNKTAVKTLGFKNYEAMIGTTPADFQCRASESAAEFQELGDQAMSKKITITSIIADHYAYGFSICLVKITPIMENGIVVGLVTHGQKLDTKNALGTVGFYLSHRYQKKYGNRQKIYTLSQQDLQFSLSPKEEECLFYMLCGKTMEETSNILNRSCRTIETHLKHIKDKMSCASKSELIEKAIVHGYMNRIPSSILTKKCIIIL